METLYIDIHEDGRHEYFWDVFSLGSLPASSVKGPEATREEIIKAERDAQTFIIGLAAASIAHRVFWRREPFSNISTEYRTGGDRVKRWFASLLFQPHYRPAHIK